MFESIQYREKQRRRTELMFFCRIAYEDDDQLLWCPDLLSENKVRDFLCEASSRTTGEKTGSDKLGSHVRDNEQVSVQWMDG